MRVALDLDKKTSLGLHKSFITQMKKQRPLHISYPMLLSCACSSSTYAALATATASAAASVRSLSACFCARMDSSTDAEARIRLPASTCGHQKEGRYESAWVVALAADHALVIMSDHTVQSVGHMPLTLAA